MTPGINGPQSDSHTVYGLGVPPPTTCSTYTLWKVYAYQAYKNKILYVLELSMNIVMRFVVQALDMMNQKDTKLYHMEILISPLL